MDSILEFFVNLIIYGIPAVLAITLHEAAHGYAALQKGDMTAKLLGRVSLNPIVHIDPLGTLILPGMLLFVGSPFVFGYAKPVPVNFGNLKKQSDMAYVAFAGPFVNIMLAFASALLLHSMVFLSTGLVPMISKMLVFSVNINVILAIFNMLPIPPLDGGRIAVSLLPDTIAKPLASLERWGFVIIIGVFIVIPLFLNQAGIGFSPFEALIKTPMIWIINGILMVVGL